MRWIVSACETSRVSILVHTPTDLESGGREFGHPGTSRAGEGAVHEPPRPRRRAQFALRSGHRNRSDDIQYPFAANVSDIATTGTGGGIHRSAPAVRMHATGAPRRRSGTGSPGAHVRIPTAGEFVSLVTSWTRSTPEPRAVPARIFLRDNATSTPPRLPGCRRWSPSADPAPPRRRPRCRRDRAPPGSHESSHTSWWSSTTGRGDQRCRSSNRTSAVEPRDRSRSARRGPSAATDRPCQRVCAGTIAKKRAGLSVRRRMPAAPPSTRGRA